MSVVERKKGGGPSGTRAQSAIKRAQIVEMRLAGHTLEQIADVVGLTSEGVRYHQLAWLAAQAPSAEQTEELRQVQAAQIDAIAAKLWPQRDDVAVVDRIVKLMDRKAKLMGIDLERGINVTMVTAEALASYLGWDDEPVLEGQAVEITDGA